MFGRCLFAAILSGCFAGFASGVEFPYTAYINTTDVYVRSGPGRDYYPTNKLQKGEEVEVYRHDPGGWLAIRPPRDSYCWVTSRHLDPKSDDMAIVNSERVVARVGSTFSDVRDVIQVRLNKGEEVELLAPASPESPWCKISPPAGEFRWVFAKYVDRELPDDLAEDQRQSGLKGKSRSASKNIRLTGGEDDAPEGSADPQLKAEMASDLERLRELDRIEFDLSTIVAEDISSWSFEELKKRADAALLSANGSLERGRARVLVGKVAKFEDIKQRHQALRASQASGTASVPAPAAAPVGGRVADPRFDGVGRLSPVVSQRSGGPQYALVDDSNAVLSFVTPAPGINLRPYVDKQIGVQGQRSYLTDLQRPHVSVQRVSLLDTQRR